MSLNEPLTEFCEGEFKIFSTPKLFSQCFETYVFVLGPFTLFAITSAFYIGRLRPPDVRLTVPSTFNIRKLCTTISILVLITQLLKDVITKEPIPPVVGLSYGVRFVSLLVHLLFLWRLCLVHFQYKRGPMIVILTWALTLPFYGVEIWRIVLILIKEMNGKIDVNWIIELFCISISAACQLIYLVVTIQGNSKYRTVSILSPNYDENVVINSGSSSSLGDRYYAVGSSDFPTELQPICPVDSASCLSKLFFCWVQPLMKKGSEKLLNNENSVYYLPQDLNTVELSETFEKNVEPNQQTDFEYETQNQDKKSHFVLKTLNKKFGKLYFSLGLLKFGGDSLAFVGPIVLNLLVNYVDSDEPLSNGWYYASALFGSTLVGSLLSTHFEYQVNKIAIGMKSCLIGAIYSKTTTSKHVYMSKYTTGEVTNFMSTDCNRIVNFCPSFHQLWSLPFQVAVTLALLYLQVGIVFLAGLGLAVIMIFFNHYLAKKIGQYNVKMMEQKDSRIKVMTEVLLGIRVVKFNVWEGFLTEKINNIRSEELKSLRGIKYFDAGCVYLWATTPVLISLLTFAIYSSLGHDLTAAKVFTVIALINMLISPLNAFPWVINGLMEAWISLERLERFISIPDRDPNLYFDAIVSAPSSEEAVKIIDGTFSWNSFVFSPEESNLLLRDISLDIKKGQFIGIIGPVGSGKSSLLSGILGSTRKVRGHVMVQGSQNEVAYVAQEPWLQHATIRENILWGLDYEQDLYETVLECCALNRDLMALPSGDLTEVGENGVTLSGGQRSRVTLARAIYQDKSIYLLDDPISAVDQHVASHLYHQCITGILREKTRVLVTHHVRYLQHADVIFEMEDGKIKAVGKPSEILGENFNKKQANIEQPTNQTQSKTKLNESKLIQVEDRAVGTVNISVYKSYWLAVGACLASLVLVFLFLMQASKVISDWWLAEWVNSNSTNHKPVNLQTDQSHNFTYVLQQPIFITDTSYTVLLGAHHNPRHPSHDPSWYLMIYGIIAGINSIFTLFRAFLFAYGGVKAAKVLHIKLLKSILQAPVTFFDTTPVGRIINRFTSDMYTVDDSLPFMLNIFLAQFVGLVATLVVTCYGLPYFTLVLIPLGVFYYYTQQYYRLSSRELKRLSSVSLSPIYVHFSESLVGMETIRAFNKDQMFRTNNNKLVDINQRCNFSTLAAQEWLAIRLQMMGVVMVTGVAITAVLEHHFQAGSAGMVGLALSYALSVTSRLSGVITSFTETEKQMVAVERQSYYINQVAQERLIPFNEIEVRGSWPQEGNIEYKQVSLRYRENLLFALKNISFNIKSGEKIGVVGRTGSGKSTILSTLFGMVPINSGTILIDGANIKRVQLQTLRSRIAIIPQDPFLFSGTIRENLDPTNKLGESTQSNTTLNWALTSCGLKVERLGGLQGQVGERGSRLSVGQRQLICLARALLKNVKIVCLDEATANVDQQSDHLIQETIKKHFSRCTVITIAHRIETVMQSDRVIVMNEGKISEFDSPQKLLQNIDSMFYKLVKTSGI